MAGIGVGAWAWVLLLRAAISPPVPANVADTSMIKMDWVRVIFGIFTCKRISDPIPRRFYYSTMTVDYEIGMKLTFGQSVDAQSQKNTG
jgi:hypothetical protein